MGSRGKPYRNPTFLRYLDLQKVYTRNKNPFQYFFIMKKVKIVVTDIN